MFHSFSFIYDKMMMKVSPVQPLSQSLLLLLLLSSLIYADDAVEASCGIYLAETSLRSAEGQWGVFAGKDFRFGDLLAPPGLAIQVLDFKQKFENQMVSEHSVSPNSIGGDMEGSGVGTLIPGLGMMMNYHSSLHNVVLGGAEFDPVLDRYTDPGAGGFTAYHGVPVIAKQEIRAGEELFMQVTNEWFHSQIPRLPLQNDYDLVDEFMRGLYEMYESIPDMSDAAMRDILRRAKFEILSSESWTDKPVVSELVPNSVEKLKDVYERGSARAELVDIDLNHIFSEGYCFDNIVQGESTIPQAGRGAFAARNIRQGSLVAPAPLLHFMNWEDLNVNESSDRKDILLNYCFGHDHSPVLLCPASSVSLINHSNTPNAKIQWAKDPSFQKKDWRSATLDELKDEFSSVLMFEVIAIEDIMKGDEIFIDYGERWEQAWNKHLSEWYPSEYREQRMKYKPANVLNKQNAPIVEDIATTYPNSLYVCRVEPYAQADPPDSNSPAPLQDYHANPSSRVANWDNITKLFFDEGQQNWWYPCDVLFVDYQQDTYTTRIYNKEVYIDQNGMLNTGGRVIREVLNTPRESIRFVDKPYMSDQHLDSAFRHEIDLPDDMFPLHWRNDYVDGKTMLSSWYKEKWDDQSSERITEHTENLKNTKCGLYYAPSTIPAAGKGLYAGIDIDAQLQVESVIPPIMIPDINWNVTDKSIRWDAHDYTWEGSAYGAEFESTKLGKLDTQILAPDIGMMGNFHPGLVNSYLAPTYFQPLLDRTSDPGAGASSDYFQHTFLANRDIQAGTEIFISYGEPWFSFRPFLHNVPLFANYVEANVLASSAISLLTGPRAKGLNDTNIEKLWRVLKKVVLEPRTKTVLSGTNTINDLIKIMHLRGTAELESEPRSLEWLEEYGECIDHIYAKESTMKQAGRGAFMRRFIAEGDVIIASPLLNNWGRQNLALHTNRTEVDGESNDMQLIYNYMYGHPESNLLLFPVTRSNMINHRSAKDGSGPNAKVRWSPTDKKTQYYLQRHLADLRQENYATLVIEYIATRDIKPDEEIFIDYGEEWDRAWTNHVSAFDKSSKRDDSSSSLYSILNLGKQSNEYQQFSSKLLVEMNNDKLNKNYHHWTKDYFNVCRLSAIPELDTDEWIEITPNEDYFGIGYDHDGYDLMRDGITWCPCVIIRVDGDTYFDVAIFAVSTENEQQRFVRRVRTVELDTVEWRPHPAKSDQHWPGAFRQEIKIPDEIFPDHWKDIKLNETVPRSIPVDIF